MDQEINLDVSEESTVSASDVNSQYVTSQLVNFVGTDLLLSLKPTQLSILNQTFRPLMVGKVDYVSGEYVYLSYVNIKMQNAPEFVFPTPLVIPVDKIAWFMPFNRATRFSIY